MQTLCALHWIAILMISVVGFALPTCGEEFRVVVPQLAGPCVYGQTRGPASFDLGTRLSSLTSIRVEIAGSYVLGWWDGDDIENFYHGPMGSSGLFEMNHDAGWSLSWSGSTRFGSNGSFNLRIPLQPHEASANWDWLRDGIGELYLSHTILIGWGRMTIYPQLVLSSVTVVVDGTAAPPESGPVLALHENGRLTWTNLFTNALFTVEWAPVLDTNVWRSDWNPLQSFWLSSTEACVDVPMFYRVKCATSLFYPMPVGARFEFSASNVLGAVWTQQLSVLALGKSVAGAGKNYAVAEVVDPHSMSLELVRSTDTEVAKIDQHTRTEVIEFKRAPVGSQWTNGSPATKVVQVQAIESVVVAAGTFDSCYKFRKWSLSNTNLYYCEWIKPGFGLVKWTDYWSEPDQTPIVYELQSWSTPSPCSH